MTGGVVCGIHGLQEKLCKAAFGPRGQAETSLKTEDLSWKYPLPPTKKKDKTKNQNKTSMAKAMGPFRDSRPLLGSPGPGPMYRLNRLSYVLVILIWPDELLILMPGGVGGINDQMWLVILLTGQVHGWWYLWPGDWLVVLMTGSAACVLVVNINDKRSDPYCGWWY
jgi:hypothetical protein